MTSKHTTPRLWKDVALLGAAALIAASSVLVSKKRGRVAFYSTFPNGGFSGNLRSVFLQMNTLAEPHEAIWLTTSAEVRDRLTADGHKVRIYRRFPLWDLLRAETIMLDAYVPYLSSGRFRLIQLWHGTGFKQIAMLNQHRRGIQKALRRRQYNLYSLIVANSEDDKARKIAGFENANVVVTGSPRNDSLLDGHGVAEIRQRLGLLRFDRIVAYCPTFRDIGEFRPFTHDFWPRLEALLVRQNTALIIKKHPSDHSLTAPADICNVFDFTSQIGDVQELLAISDVLISDYSGIIVDYALLGRPMVFHVFDFEKYAGESRDLYYDLRQTLPGPFSTTGDELIALLDDLSWSDTPSYRTRYSRFRDQFHLYKDSQSTQRVLKAVFGGGTRQSSPHDDVPGRRIAPAIEITAQASNLHGAESQAACRSIG